MVLARHNIVSEFSGGVLFCCNGKVALRRHDSGRVTIEGCVSEEYYQVRELLYQQYRVESWMFVQRAPKRLKLKKDNPIPVMQKIPI